MQKLLIATSNSGKVAQYRDYLKGLPLELVSLKDVGLISIEETGTTLEQNALLKARTYFEQSGLPCIADDGGFEIDFLNGAPGVYSRR
jgi:XTP/dITP diphosphohydrolase